MRAPTRLLVALAALAAFAPVASAEGSMFSGGTRAYGGDTINVTTPTDGNLVLFGGTVHVTAPVQGSVMIAAGDVVLDAPVSGDVIVAAGNIRILSTVTGSVSAAGGNIELGPESVVGGQLSAAGGTAKIAGRTSSRADLHAGSVLLDGTIGGDARISTQELRLGESSSITGNLDYRGPALAAAAVTSHVRGTVQQNAAHERSTGPFGDLGRGVWILGLLMSLCTAFLLSLLAPALPAVALNRFARRPIRSWFTGLLTFLAVFPLILLLFTFILAPVAGIALAVWLILVLLTKVFLAIILGEALLRALRVRPTVFRRVVAVLISLFVLATLGTVTIVNGLVAFLLFPAALGAVVLAIPGVLRVDRALVPASLATSATSGAVAAPVVARKAPARRAPVKRTTRKK